MTLRIAWFATAKGTSSTLLFESTQAAIAAGRLDAEIVVVFCNRERGQSANTDAFLAAVTAAKIPLIMISSGAWRKRVDGALSAPGGALAPWRHDFDRAVVQALGPYRPEVGVLAGYMLVTTAPLCEQLPLLNLHPAEPGGPVGTWQEVIQALIAAGATRSGLMMQRVTTDLDRGPIVSFCSYAIRGGELDALWAGVAAAGNPTAVDSATGLFQAIRAEGVRREPAFIEASLQALAALPGVALPGVGLPGRGERGLGEAGLGVDVTADVERVVEARRRAGDSTGG